MGYPEEVKMRSRIIGWLALVFFATGLFVACNRQAAPGTNPGPGPGTGPKPGFDLALNVNTLNLLQWDSATLTLTITPKNGFSGTLQLTLDPKPDGVSLSPTSVEVSGSAAKTVQLTLSAAEDATPGRFDLAVKASGGGVTKSQSLTLNLRELPKRWALRSTPLRGVAASADGQTLVAVGVGGSVLRSTDGGETWALDSVGEDADLRAVAFGNERFVAVGIGKNAYVSEDGIHWTAHPLDPDNGNASYGLYTIAFGDHGFVAAGAGYVFTSTDGETWRLLKEFDRRSFCGSTYGANKYVLAGYDYSLGSGVLVSFGFDTDRVDVFVTHTNHDDVCSVTYDGHQFVAAAFQKKWTSTDGVNWNEDSNFPNVSRPRLAYGDGTYVAVGCCGSVAASGDADTWSEFGLYLSETPRVSAATFLGVTYTGSTFVAVGNGGQVATSNDGSTWSFPAFETPSWSIQGIGYDGARFLAVDGGDGRIFASADGVSWQPLAQMDHYLTDIAYDGTAYAAVGYKYIETGKPNGQEIGWSSYFAGDGVNAVAAGGGEFVAVGDSGSIWTSSDHGKSWNQVSSPTAAKLLDVAFGSSTFVAVGESGTVVYNAGNGWETADAGTQNDLQAVAFGHGRFVAVGKQGTVRVSEDGTSWHAPSDFPADAAGANLRAVAYGERGFVAAGYVSGKPTAFYSPDGERWREVALPAGAKPYSVAAGGGRYLIGGEGGLILVTP